MYEIKSKYLGLWQSRKIRVDNQKQSLFFSRKGNSDRQIKFSDIHSFRFYNKGNMLEIVASRLYTIKAKNKEDLQPLSNSLMLWKALKEVNGFHQKKVPVPKRIDYFLENNKEKINTSLRESIIQHFEEGRDEYYCPKDWKKNEKEGGLEFINKEKKDKQKGVVGFVMSKFLKTRSFSGISFPAFAMKPQSQLETYCKCLSLAPELLKEATTPLERIKLFNCLILTFSLRFTDTQKSFSPVLGETFQGKVGDCNFYAENTCHHPLINSFLVVGKTFRVYGSLELNADIGLNSAVGCFYGDVVAEFSDGGIVRGSVPKGMLQGFVFGKNYFVPTGSAYSYDEKNKLVCSYEIYKKDIFKGFIGKLKPKIHEKFMEVVTSKDKVKEKYLNFSHLTESKFQEIKSRMECIWSKSVSFDGKIYLGYDDPEQQPPKLRPVDTNMLLKSNCTFRNDIMLRKKNKLEEAQQEKQALEEEQRTFLKMRKAHIKK